MHHARHFSEAEWGWGDKGLDPWPQVAPYLVEESWRSHLESYLELQGSVCWVSTEESWPFGIPVGKRDLEPPGSGFWAGLEEQDVENRGLRDRCLPTSYLYLMTSMNRRKIKFEHIWATVFWVSLLQQLSLWLNQYICGTVLELTFF